MPVDAQPHDTPDVDTEPPPPTHEKFESLWWLAVSPAIWAGHLLVVYTTVAVYCARAPSRSASLSSLWWPLAIFTLVAAAGIVATGVRGLRRHRFGTATVPHDFDTPEDRHRFIGFAVLLISGLSLVAVVFVSLPAAFMGTCQ